MEITKKLLEDLQNRLKVGNRRGVHLNAIPGRSRYKFDVTRLGHIDENLPSNFINSLLTKLPLKFKISWRDNVPDLNSLFEDDQIQLVKITKSFENLINQTDAIESEKGINTFGFGFPLLVRKDQSDNKLTVAPILIWSLRIKRTRDFNTWEILRTEDDPIYINEVLINHLQNDSKIEIDQISTDFLDDGLIDKEELLDICVNLINAINSTIPDNLRETFEEKLKTIQPIPDKKHYEELSLTSNNSFIDFGGLFSIFEVQKQNIIHDYSNLLALAGTTIDLGDMDEHSFQPISSVETDPSQQGILHALKKSRNILIQGPPGTGKSQSLTAILVNALENKKKTIVVCEKRTALEVLHNALNERSLNYQSVLIKDIVKDRRVVVNSVRDRVDNSSYKRYTYNHSKETLDQIIDKSKDLIDAINKRHKKVGALLIGNKNWTHIVGDLLSELKENTEEYNINIAKEIFKFESSELNNLLELIRKGESLYDDYQPCKELTFINPDKLQGENPFAIEQQIKDDFLVYKEKLEIIHKDLLKYEAAYYKIRKAQFEEQKRANEKLEKAISELFKKHQTNDDFLNEEKTTGFFFKLLSFFSKEKKTTLLDQETIKVLFQEYASTIKRTKDFNTLEFTNSIKENQNAFKEYESVAKKITASFQSKIENEYTFLNLLESIENEFITELSEAIKVNLNSLKNNINQQNWPIETLHQNSHKELILKIEQLINGKEEFFNHENDLFSIAFKWFQFYNSLTEEYALIIDELTNTENWRKTFLIYYLNSMLINAANMDLPTNDNDHIELKKSLSELEDEQIKYIKEYWFSKQIDATRAFDEKHLNLAVENLYNKRSGKRHKRLSLREIVKMDLDLFATFFPIILTTPDVASNLFKGQNQYFDIVMFDEASQLKLEDNFPALLKGKQIIIAGDEHQMPPSNYFSKIFDGAIDDEDEFEDEIDKIKNDISNSLLDCESLLDFASELGFEKKHLDFHYRSRHPYLIDYSNYAFYNQRLKPLPNSFNYIPINYVAVNGTYSENSNDAEAETVLSILDKNIARLPSGKYPTVGVATFNINQRNLILSKINERRKFPKFNDFNDKIIELEENGFFVKNLENIQGDERDVIILSTTYGINSEGKFAQRFGSINHQKGYKLLNVIVTRAKFKIYVCTSIPEEVFLNYREHLVNEGANNRRGAFYAYLAYAKAVSEQNKEARNTVLNILAENATKSTTFINFNEALESPFEEEVYKALRNHFNEDNIITQLQFAGFRIDLVYDAKIEGIPRIAIECDGASYHSSQEAYLHDLHRQKILEKHGFVFHRIWSTNWWRNSKRETKKLVEFIKNIKNSDPANFEDKSKTGLAFTDNVVIVENILSKVAPKLSEDLKETITAVQIKKEHKNEVTKETIGINSEVKIKYLNIDEDLNIQIVKELNTKTKTAKGLQKVGVKTLLGKSLQGKSVGDTVKIGNLDKFVRILEIVN